MNVRSTHPQLERYEFELCMGLKLISEGDVPAKEAYLLAQDLLSEHLYYAHVDYGDPRYDWSRFAAYELVESEWLAYGDEEG